jgi:S-adenosylmethionine:tRNA ribosyltransferase-isomerase
VLNDTRVIPARVHGRKVTGGSVEIMAERIISDTEVLAQLRSSKPNRPGTRIEIDAGVEFEVGERRGELYTLLLHADRDLNEVLEHYGHIPLPPYIRRPDEANDRERYQTVYARTAGAVAAPTAGLHFTEALLDEIRNRNVELAYVTLHVGLGTFQPVREDELGKHRMHSERVFVDAAACDAVAKTHAAGGRVIAVGTTVVRSLEAAAAGGSLQPYDGETDLFILPGYRFRVVDALLTNFHLPESTLLMLVCAFGGRDYVLAAYRHAVAGSYRFFSYGDAMFLTAAARL